MIKFISKAWVIFKQCLSNINTDDRLYEFPHKNPEVPGNRPTPPPKYPSLPHNQKALEEQFWTRVFEEAVTCNMSIPDATDRADRALEVYKRRFRPDEET